MDSVDPSSNARHSYPAVAPGRPGMRVEVWVSSAEPAVGGSVTPGTRLLLMGRSALVGAA